MKQNIEKINYVSFETSQDLRGFTKSMDISSNDSTSSAWFVSIMSSAHSKQIIDHRSYSKVKNTAAQRTHSTYLCELRF